MADYRTMQSAALISILLWHRVNKMMQNRGNVVAPALGSFEDRALAFAGVENADLLVPFLLGFNPEEGTMEGTDFSNAVLMTMTTQLDADAMTGQMLFASPPRGQSGGSGGFGGSFLQAMLPGWFVWNLDGDNGPFCIWKYISKKALNAVRRSTATRWFRGQGGRSQSQTRRRS